VDSKISRGGRLDDSPRGPLRILFVGRLSVEKGVEDLVRACLRLQQKEVPFRLSIIGDGNLKTSLRDLVARYDLSEMVEFIGTVPRLELGSHYSAADVLCVPSLSEPLATVILEALISGCPVVASDTGGNPFMVRHNRNGLLTPVGDVEALANALERLYRNPALLRLLTQHARPSVLERFLWKSVAKDIASYILKYLTVCISY